MDSKLTKVACQHLQIFIAICDRTVALRESKLAKLKMFTSNFFLGDKTVSPLLDDMRSLVDRERGLVASLAFRYAAETLQYSRDAAHNSRDNLRLAQGIDVKLDSMNEKMSLQQGVEEAKTWKEAIARAVGFGDENRDKIIAEKEKLKESRVAGTGDWLLSEEAFMSWTQPGARRTVLVLEGLNGSGKSHLMHNALRHLRRFHEEHSRSKLAMSYYFHQTDARDSSTRNEICSRILKSLFWQCCLAHEPLTKAIASVCEKRRTGEFESVLDVWSCLLLENNDVQKLGVNFVLVVDGLESLIDVLVSLLQRIQSSSVFRVLLTTRPGGASSMLGAVMDMLYAIPLEHKTGPDIELYIISRLDSMDMFRDSSRPGIADWRIKVHNTLRDKTGGDYVKVVKCLDDIEKTHLVKEIQEVLDGAGKTRSDQIESEIQGLNESRTAQEIVEINEIVLWLNSARTSLSPDQLDAVLAVGQPGDGLSSLLTLEAKLRSRYTLFGINAAGNVEYRSPEARDCIPQKSKQTITEFDLVTPKQIYPAEVNMVRHLLRAICPSDIYDKLGFEPFLEAALNRARNYICEDPDNSEVRIALTCLRVLTEPRNQKTAKLQPYAAQYLLSHLQKTDLSLADRELKAQVGCLLVKLFREDFGIDSLFWPVDHEDRTYSEWLTEVQPWAKLARSAWIHTADGPKELVRWFKDTAVFRGIPDGEGREWATDLIREGANFHGISLRYASKRMAIHLLRYAFWREEVCTALSFWAGYLERVSSSMSEDISSAKRLTYF